MDNTPEKQPISLTEVLRATLEAVDAIRKARGMQPLLDQLSHAAWFKAEMPAEEVAHQKPILPRAVKQSSDY